MTVKAAREPEISADEFRALEEKVYRTIELLKAAREAKAAAEKEAARLRQQIASHDDELDRLRAESVSLRRDREEVRTRVEKMLTQIDALTGADSEG